MRREKACGFRTGWMVSAGIAFALALPPLQAQSTQNQTQGQQPANSHPEQDIPDAPSTVQPPAPKLPPTPEPEKPDSSSSSKDTPQQPAQHPPAGEGQQPAAPPMPPVQTLPEGTPLPPQIPGGQPRNQINPAEDLYKFTVTTNFVQVPVMVKNSQGQRVDGLLPKDFVVKENGEVQKLTYFTSDPFLLSVAVVLDLGMTDVTLQQVNQTYSALVGAFSPYDEFALYTFSSTVTQVTDFTNHAPRLTAALDEIKLVRGRNGPPVLGGPLGPQGPMINGMPAGTSGPPPVITPPVESHVLNDAILRAAIDLSKRDRNRRKVILVVSDGRERGSQASFRQVLKVLQTHGIQVKAVVVGQGALPAYKQVEKIHHVLWQGYSDILPKYTNATGGGSILTELSRNSIEDAYSEITSDARNQYTLGYSPKAVKGGSPYRSIEVLVDRKNLKIYAKEGYYPVPAAR